MPAKLCCPFGHVADGEGCCVIHKAHLQVQTRCHYSHPAVQVQHVLVQGSVCSVHPPANACKCCLGQCKDWPLELGVPLTHHLADSTKSHISAQANTMLTMPRSRMETLCCSIWGTTFCIMPLAALNVKAPRSLINTSPAAGGRETSVGSVVLCAVMLHYKQVDEECFEQLVPQGTFRRVSSLAACRLT